MCKLPNRLTSKDVSHFQLTLCNVQCAFNYASIFCFLSSTWNFSIWLNHWNGWVWVWIWVWIWVLTMEIDVLWKTMAWFKSWLNGVMMTNIRLNYHKQSSDFYLFKCWCCFFSRPLKLINSFVQSSLGYKSIHLFIRFRIVCIFLSVHIYSVLFFFRGTICYC